MFSAILLVLARDTTKKNHVISFSPFPLSLPLLLRLCVLRTPSSPQILLLSATYSKLHREFSKKYQEKRQIEREKATPMIEFERYDDESFLLFLAIVFPLHIYPGILQWCDYSCFLTKKLLKLNAELTMRPTLWVNEANEQKSGLKKDKNEKGGEESGSSEKKGGGLSSHVSGTSKCMLEIWSQG